VLLAVGDSYVLELGVFFLLGCCEDERWVGGGILRLVFANCWKIISIRFWWSEFGDRSMKRIEGRCIDDVGMVGLLTCEITCAACMLA